MKREETKKHFKEGSKGLSQGSIKLLSLAVFLFLSNSYYSQSLVYSKISTEIPSGFHEYIEFEYNDDGYPDYLVYGNKIENSFVIIPGSELGFHKPIKKFFYYPITKIVQLQNSNNEEHFLFISRKERLAGLLSFTNYGTALLLNENKLDSFPSKLITVDLNGDGNDEALIFGENFDGINVLQEKKYILHDKKYFRNYSFSSVVPFDLDHNSSMDLIAIDLISNKLVFIYNFEDELRILREVILDDNFKDLIALDLNNSKNMELVLYNTSKLKILYGNISDNNYLTKDIFVDDFSSELRFVDKNLDSLKDFVYLNYNKRLKGKLSSGKFSFEKSMDLVHNDEILSYSTDSLYRKINYINKNNQFCELNRFDQITDKFSLETRSKPFFVKAIKNSNNRLQDIIYADSSNAWLNKFSAISDTTWENSKSIPLTSVINSGNILNETLAYSVTQKNNEKVYYSFNSKNGFQINDSLLFEQNPNSVDSNSLSYIFDERKLSNLVLKNDSLFYRRILGDRFSLIDSSVSSITTITFDGRYKVNYLKRKLDTLILRTINLSNFEFSDRRIKKIPFKNPIYIKVSNYNNTHFYDYNVDSTGLSKYTWSKYLTNNFVSSYNFIEVKKIEDKQFLIAYNKEKSRIVVFNINKGLKKLISKTNINYSGMDLAHIYEKGFYLVYSNSNDNVINFQKILND